MQITDDQYMEYQNLKALVSNLEYKQVVDSAKSITTLEDDIDQPIKKCVMMLALMGCSPKYSCCGFNYYGQPLHKTHQIDVPYVMMEINDNVRKLMQRFINESRWKFSNHLDNNKLISLVLTTPRNPFWRKQNCIHHSEETAIAISHLERWLFYTYKDYFLDYIILQDTNNYTNVPYWQYPPKSEWLIKKEDLMKII